MARWLGGALLVLGFNFGAGPTAIIPAAAATTTTIDPGRLPPTSVEPATGAPLTARMTTLWHAIVAGNPALSRRVFFPRSAYVRMKTGLLQSPSDDYADRLIALFDLDVSAYHQRIASNGAPRLVGVRANRADAAYIVPRRCENLIGYWHLPGVRLVFRNATKVWSVAVDSLISWRGVWYVVHLGPNPRAHDVGTVDDFRAGPGAPGPPGGC